MMAPELARKTLPFLVGEDEPALASYAAGNRSRSSSELSRQYVFERS
ncbi:MAG: hypothetical protein J2P13_00295 [Acidobacteria bacterium]|nr:hypothetical protein [Acidobacteriota bacterium]